MSLYLVDTNVISEFVKPTPNPQVLHWLRSTDISTLAASLITVGELRLGVEHLPQGKRRTGLNDWLETGLPAWFSSNLLPVTREIADSWAALPSRRRG